MYRGLANHENTLNQVLNPAWPWAIQALGHVRSPPALDEQQSFVDPNEASSWSKRCLQFLFCGFRHLYAYLTHVDPELNF